MPRDVKAANPFHSLAALQKLAHHASFWSATAPAVAFPHDHDLHSAALGRQPANDRIFCTLFKAHPFEGVQLQVVGKLSCTTGIGFG